MKRLWKICLALLGCVSVLFFSSCRVLLATGVLAFDQKQEEKRQASRMDAVVEDVNLTVEEQGENAFLVDVAFWLQNNGEYDSDDWELTIYYYDEDGYLIYAYTIGEESYSYDKNVQAFKVIKSGEKKELRVNNCVLPYRPITVKIEDVDLFH